MGHEAGALRVIICDDPPTLTVTGDVDVVSMVMFSDAIERVVTDFAGDVEVDFTGAGFIDMEGLRTLARAAQTMAEGGRKLVLLNLATHLHEVLRIVGWSENLALVKQGDES